MTRSRPELNPNDGYIAELGDGDREVAAGGRVLARGPLELDVAMVMLEEHTPTGRTRWHVDVDGTAREL